MTEQHQFKFSPLTLAFPLYFVLLLWVVFWFEIKFNVNFIKYGIYPRTFKGLRGIVFSPLVHGGVSHLYQNSIPLFVLLFSLLFFYKKIAYKIFFYGWILTGIFTWIIARRSFHIGASGLIYMLFSFIFFSGVIRKYYRLIAVSLMVIFLYGSMVWYMLPVKDEISWEGHVSGFVSGLILAFLYRNTGPELPAFEWEEEDYEPDEFDRLFDENGNLIHQEENEELNSEKTTDKTENQN